MFSWAAWWLGSRLTRSDRTVSDQGCFAAGTTLAWRVIAECGVPGGLFAWDMISDFFEGGLLRGCPRVRGALVSADLLVGSYFWLGEWGGGMGIGFRNELIHSTELGGGGAREVLPLLLGANRNLQCRAASGHR